MEYFGWACDLKKTIFDEFYVILRKTYGFVAIFPFLGDNGNF